MSVLQSLIYDRSTQSMQVLDQLKLPSEKVYIDIKTSADAWRVIREMNIRGAPLIAMVAALGIAVDAGHQSFASESDADSRQAACTFLSKQMEYLRTSRPTAVNLFNAMDALGAVVTKAAGESASGREVVGSFAAAAEDMLEADVADNRGIGRFGADAILSRAGKERVRVMTVCNTGSLATAGYGTALGVVRALHERGALEEVVVLETRPYNQGSRLTAFEVVEEHMPGRLICDNMAASYMKRIGCDAVVVGADRVCSNGDTANKIGTYMLAVLAKHHGVPFYVAAPLTSLDLSMKSGEGITIEERKAAELLETSGAPSGIPVWNPAFDVTPGELIAGVVTELGVVEQRDGAIDCADFVTVNASKRRRI